MMRAYDEIYLNDAMKNLGEAFDYAATVLNIPMDDFSEMFIISGIAEQFSRGVPKFVSGLSVRVEALVPRAIQMSSTAIFCWR